jgi:hypothetical protein
MFNIIVNSSNVSSPLNNIYTYQFKQGSIAIEEGSEMMVSSFVIPYSWYNISAKYNNNIFKFYWPTGTTTYTPFTVTIPDGFYLQSAFNAYMQQFFITNGLYNIDGSGNNVYYFSFLSNSTSYANQALLKIVPTSKPVGYSTDPTNFAGYPTTARTPYFEILSTNNFGKYAGFTAGTYPATPVSQITAYSVLSNITPLTTTANALVLKCSLVNNGVSNQSDVLDAFSIGASSTTPTFGSNLSFMNNIEKWTNLSSGRYNNLIFSIVDQNLNEISILDNNILISVLIRNKKEK